MKFKNYFVKLLFLNYDFWFQANDSFEKIILALDVDIGNSLVLSFKAIDFLVTSPALELNYLKDKFH